MSAVVVQTGAFNKHLLELLKMLMTKFPEDRDISVIHSQVETASRLTPRLTVVHFIKEVLPFTDHIESRNEAFFLQLVKNEYDDVIGYLNLPNKWQCFNDREREFLWKNIQNLTTLGRKILCL